MTTQNDECQVNMKPGWVCTRGFHADGPCALVEDSQVVTSPVCMTCGLSTDHTGMKHPFNDGSLSGAARLTPQGHQPSSVRRVTMPFDPVLRQALVDAGVITPEQLQVAELKIQAITGQVFGGPS